MGKCTGSGNCNACKTCNYCKYCNSGGSCGVCGKTTTSRSSTTNNFSNSSKFSDDPHSPYYLKVLRVTAKTLNLRTGPGSNYVILKELDQDEELTFLAQSGNWVKVRTKNFYNNLTGYIFYKYVVVEN